MEANWKHPEQNIQFGLSVYGPQRVSFTKVLHDPNNGIDLMAMMKDSLV